MPIDLSIFTTPEAWISLATLIFLELVLGVDNIVFISITSDRLPEHQQHIGRRLGLAGAMCMRILFLCFASWLVHMTASVFTFEIPGIYSHGFSIRDIVLLVGGIYLIYKGVIELRSIMGLDEVKEKAEHAEKKRQISLPRAVLTIMVMDIVFSIDSVITAVGLAEHLIIMIIAVMAAVIVMMIFIDFISDFINKNVEMKILALAFIAAVGVLLVMDSLGLGSGQEMLGMPTEKLMVYFGMGFSLLLALLQLRYKTKLHDYLLEHDDDGVLPTDAVEMGDTTAGLLDDEVVPIENPQIET